VTRRAIGLAAFTLGCAYLAWSVYGTISIVLAIIFASLQIFFALGAFAIWVASACKRD